MCGDSEYTRNLCYLLEFNFSVNLKRLCKIKFIKKRSGLNN